MAKKKKPYEYKPAGLEYLKGYGPGTPTYAADYRAPTVTAPAAPATFTAPDIRDATYNDVINGAWRNLGDITAGIAGQQALLRGRYGYLDNNFTLNPNDPFGQAQLLQRSFEQSKAGTQNSYAARGQQTSGAYNRAQRGNLFNFNQRNDALQKSFLSDNAGLLGQLTAATNAYRDTATGAAGAALGRAIQNRTGALSNAPVDRDPIVKTYTDANGNRVNVHASGRKATIKKR